MDNSTREDLRLARHPELYRWLVGRLLPPREQFTLRWDKHPCDAVGGETAAVNPRASAGYCPIG